MARASRKLAVAAAGGSAVAAHAGSFLLAAAPSLDASQDFGRGHAYRIADANQRVYGRALVIVLQQREVGAVNPSPRPRHGGIRYVPAIRSCSDRVGHRSAKAT